MHIHSRSTENTGEKNKNITPARDQRSLWLNLLCTSLLDVFYSLHVHSVYLCFNQNEMYVLLGTCFCFCFVVNLYCFHFSKYLLKYFKNNLLQYCHYVAGLVGIGLSRLFSASELEDPLVGEDVERANSMGLFLQKTNIIRDYLEDQREGREFWPQEVTELGHLGKIVSNTF